MAFQQGTETDLDTDWPYLLFDGWLTSCPLSCPPLSLSVSLFHSINFSDVPSCPVLRPWTLDKQRLLPLTMLIHVIHMVESQCPMNQCKNAQRLAWWAASRDVKEGTQQDNNWICRIYWCHPRENVSSPQRHKEKMWTCKAYLFIKKKPLRLRLNIWYGVLWCIIM